MINKLLDYLISQVVEDSPEAVVVIGLVGGLLVAGLSVMAACAAALLG